MPLASISILLIITTKIHFPVLHILTTIISIYFEHKTLYCTFHAKRTHTLCSRTNSKLYLLRVQTFVNKIKIEFTSKKFVFIMCILLLPLVAFSRIFHMALIGMALSIFLFCIVGDNSSPILSFLLKTNINFTVACRAISNDKSYQLLFESCDHSVVSWLSNTNSTYFRLVCLEQVLFWNRYGCSCFRFNFILPPSSACCFSTCRLLSGQSSSPYHIVGKFHIGIDILLYESSLYRSTLTCFLTATLRDPYLEINNLGNLKRLIIGIWLAFREILFRYIIRWNYSVFLLLYILFYLHLCKVRLFLNNISSNKRI